MDAEKQSRAAEEEDSQEVDAVKRTNVYRKADEELTKATAALTDACAQAASRLKDIDPDHLKQDKAFQAYADTSTFRLKTGMVVLGLVSSLQFAGSRNPAVADGCPEDGDAQT